MKILVINAGSSSLKYQLIDMEGETVAAKGQVERIGIEGTHFKQQVGGNVIEYSRNMKDHVEAIEAVMSALTDPEKGAIRSMDEISAVGHRVLHGGETFKESVLVTEETMKGMKALVPLGPLHMPANLMGIESCQKVMPNTPNVAVFDTAFHQTMPPKAYLYAIPYDYYKRLQIRRYGFHGTSHRYVASVVPQMLGKNKRPMESHYPFFFMGYNLLADNAFGFSGSAALHTRDSKSWEFGFTLASVAFRLGGNFALTTAMQTTWAYNHFQGNNVMTTTDGMSSLEKKEDVKVKKSYITYSTIRIPLMMEWSEKSFYAGLGASVDMRMSGKSKYRANKKTRTQTDDINLNPLGLNLEMRLGYGALMIYGRAGLTPLLKTGRAPKCYSASFGMGIRL